MSHPAAELLAAFADRSLSRAERTEVMDHVAHCAECRACLLFATSPRKQLLRAFTLCHRSSAVALCTIPLLAIVLFITQRTPRPSLPISAAAALPSGLLNVSLLDAPRDFSQRAPLNAKLRASSNFDLSFETRIVVQTERGERWLTLVNPLSGGKRN